MEGMTEEQKEHEAMKLVNMFDKLSRYWDMVCVRVTSVTNLTLAAFPRPGGIWEWEWQGNSALSIAP